MPKNSPAIIAGFVPINLENVGPIKDFSDGVKGY
jgi:hypothetical protein